MGHGQGEGDARKLRSRPVGDDLRGTEAARSVGQAVGDLLRSYGPWFFGLCCGNIWIGWMNGAHALEPIAAWNVACAATMVGTLLVAVWYGWRHDGRPVSGSYLADWPIAVLMAAATLPAAGLIGPTSHLSALISTVLTEIGMAWLYVRWGVFLGKLDIRSTVGCIFAAHVVGCAAKLALYYVPTVVSAVPVALLPLVSLVSLRLACTRATLSEERLRSEGQGGVEGTVRGAPPVIWCSGTRGSWGPLWKVAAFVACYRVLFWAVGTDGGSAGIPSLSAVCCLAEIAVSLVIIYMLLVRSGSFTFQQVWSIFLILMGIVLLCTMNPTTMALGAAIRAAAGSLLVMFTWLVFADILHHSTLHPFVIFGVARIAYEVPRLLVEGLALAGAMPMAGDAFFTGVLFFALLVFAVLFFDWRDPTLALIFSDFQKRPEAPAADAVLQVCQQATRDFGLTQREGQVLLYLCQGRTRAYIAETLYLSENTVRGHTQRIYGKLGVHNKTELQRLLGV